MNEQRPWQSGRSPMELAGLVPASSVSAAADAAGDEETADEVEQRSATTEQEIGVDESWFGPRDDEAPAPDTGVSEIRLTPPDAEATDESWFAQQDAEASAQADAAAPDHTPDFAEAEDDEAEEQHPASIAFWNRVEPITERVILNYQERRVTFRILDFAQEEQVLDIIQPAPAHRRTLAEARTRLYFALVAIDGRKTLPLGPAREAWIKRIPGPFVDALLQAYHRAAQRPVEELNKVTSDPFTDAARLQSGAF